MKRILIIAAHPDDDILGCGGLMSKYSQADISFRVIIIAEGTSCRFTADSPLVTDEIEKRTQFGIQALSVLKQSNYHFYNLPCGRLHLISQLKINKIIEDEIKNFKPDTIFTHSLNDTNSDHRTVYESTLTASRPLKGKTIPKLYSYEVLSSSEWRYDKSFEPSFFISLTKKDVDQKVKAMEKYTTEQQDFPHPRSSEGIYTLAKFRGMQMNSEYAEAFCLIREFSF